MSYPPPLYRGDDGEASAAYRPVATPPEISNQPGNDVHYLATGESTGGQLGLYRWEFGPKRSGPDPHFHRAITESFYILSGAVQVYDGTRWVDTSPGDFLFVPQGGVHGFKNVSGEPASMLILFTPGAPREEYFEVLADIGQGRRDPLVGAERDAFMAKHDTYWLDD
ncbi:cupin domain-containing protein [Angustibacter sp. McL0619]|uniref:cupin domain-containing protein n=1 Tax=Angustibacter sp. McL0619 TaxID=3415676 RepID=UPI003CE9A4E2